MFSSYLVDDLLAAENKSHSFPFPTVFPTVFPIFQVFLGFLSMKETLKNENWEVIMERTSRNWKLLTWDGTDFTGVEEFLYILVTLPKSNLIFSFLPPHYRTGKDLGKLSLQFKLRSFPVPFVYINFISSFFWVPYSFLSHSSFQVSFSNLQVASDQLIRISSPYQYMFLSKFYIPA